MHSPINRFVAGSFLISLDRALGRRDKCLSQLSRHGISAEVFPAIDGLDYNSKVVRRLRPGQWGCLRSHLEILQKSAELSLSSVLILEDDFILDEDFNSKFSSYCLDIPSDWDLVYLGGVHFKEPVPITEHCHRCVYTMTTHALIIRDTAFSKCIAALEPENSPVDNCYAMLQRNDIINAYVLRPHLCWQDVGYSYTMGAPTNSFHKRAMLKK